MKKSLYPFSTILLIVVYCSFVHAARNCACEELYDISVTVSVGEKIETRYGLINSKGKVVLEPIFNDVQVLGEGLAIATAIDAKPTGRNKDGLLLYEFTAALIDVQGNKTILPDTLIIGVFSEGLAFAQVKGRYVYLDKSGNTKIALPDGIEIANSRYGSNEVFPFTNGSAGVMAANGGMYLVNKQGEVRFLTEEESRRDENGLAIVEKQGKYAIIDRQGNHIFGPQENYINEGEGVFTVCPRNENEGKCSFIDTKGVRLFDRYFDEAKLFSNGLAGVKINGKWGYLNKSGKVIVPPRFSDAWDFVAGLSAVEKKGKWGFIDKLGKFIISPKYDYVDNFDCELAHVRLNDDLGYINKKGKWVWREK